MSKAEIQGGKVRFRFRKTKIEQKGLGSVSHLLRPSLDLPVDSSRRAGRLLLLGAQPREEQRSVAAIDRGPGREDRDYEVPFPSV
jgi:hypothetical protein